MPVSGDPVNVFVGPVIIFRFNVSPCRSEHYKSGVIVSFDCQLASSRVS